MVSGRSTRPAARRPACWPRGTPAAACSCRRPRPRRRSRTQAAASVSQISWPAAPWCGTKVQRQPHDQRLHRILDVLAGIHCRAPISACPVPSRTNDTCTVLIPFATRPAQPMYCRFTPAVARPAFSCPVSSIAPITRRPRRPAAAAPSRPAAPNRDHAHRREPVPGRVVKSRCVLSGDRSPASLAIVHPFRFGSSLTSADMYLPPAAAPSARSTTARLQQLGPFPAGEPAPILAAAAAFACCPHKHMIVRRLRPCGEPGARPRRKH